jgi:RNA polymerase sigma-70 factor (ECF subfamily)
MNNVPEPSISDSELIRVIRQHSSDVAFSQLYDRHTPRALQTAWRLFGRNIHEAEDAVQEAWVRAISTLGTWRGNDFGAWLRGIVAHVAIDALRREQRLTSTDEIEQSITYDPGERIDLETAIATLPPGYRAVLVLHDIEGFTHEEIGERLGITPGTSKGQLFKARRAIRAKLAVNTAERA